MQLHDIINEEEAQAFISSCEGHFERSLAGDQLNPVRQIAIAASGGPALAPAELPVHAAIS